MNNIVVKNVKDSKFYAVNGYMMTTGFGFFDTEKGLFIKSNRDYRPWTYKTKKTAQLVADSFNTEGFGDEPKYINFYEGEDF